MSTSSIQDQYAGIVKQGQDAALSIVDAWARSVRGTAVRVPSASAQAAVLQVVDQYFDFASTVLNVQRGYAKNLVTSTASVVEDVARRTGERVQETAYQATAAAEGTVDEVARAARAPKTD